MAEEEEKTKELSELLGEQLPAYQMLWTETTWKAMAEALPKLSEGIVDTFVRGIGDKLTNVSDALADIALSLKLVDEPHARFLKELGRAWGPFSAIPSIYMLLSLFLSYLGNLSTAMGGKALQDLNVSFSPNPPGPGEVIQAAFIAPEKTGEVRDAMRRAGLSDKDIDLLFLASYRLYDPETIRMAWLRGILSEDEMFMRMRELGFTDTRIKEIVQTWPVIPGVQDLLMMYAKEAFEPDIIEKTGLDQEFPEEGVPHLAALGVSREWALKYWYAHWDYPSLEQGFDMHRRGLISDEELDMLHRIVETPKFWRDKLQGIAYSPYTRVDIRRMHKMQVITDEELVENYRWAGYDQAHAEKLAEFTIIYNQQDTKSLAVGQIIRGYADKYLTREDCTELLGQLKYSESQADFLLTLEDYEEQQDVQNDIITAIKDRYQNNLMERTEAEDRLNKLNLPAIKISSLLERWEVRRLMDVKMPSKTDLDKFLRNKIINEDKYRYEMQKLGYGWVYTDWYLSLIKKGKAG